MQDWECGVQYLILLALGAPNGAPAAAPCRGAIVGPEVLTPRSEALQPARPMGTLKTSFILTIAAEEYTE